MWPISSQLIIIDEWLNPGLSPSAQPLPPSTATWFKDGLVESFPGQVWPLGLSLLHLLPSQGKSNPHWPINHLYRDGRGAHGLQCDSIASGHWPRHWPRSWCLWGWTGRARSVALRHAASHVTKVTQKVARSCGCTARRAHQPSPCEPRAWEFKVETGPNPRGAGRS